MLNVFGVGFTARSLADPNLASVRLYLRGEIVTEETKDRWTICFDCMRVVDFEADHRGLCGCGVSSPGANGPRRRVMPVADLPAICKKEQDRCREARHKRLLGDGWPEVTMMRDAGSKSSPPWCWWMEDDGYNHDYYETERYVPISQLDQRDKEVRERLENLIPVSQLPALDAIFKKADDA